MTDNLIEVLDGLRNAIASRETAKQDLSTWELEVARLSRAVISLLSGDNADKPIVIAQHAGVEKLDAVKPKRRGRTSKWTPERAALLRRLYNDEKLSNVEIGRRLGISTAHVNSKRIALGIPARNQAKSELARGNQNARKAA